MSSKPIVFFPLLFLPASQFRSRGNVATSVVVKNSAGVAIPSTREIQAHDNAEPVPAGLDAGFMVHLSANITSSPRGVNVTLELRGGQDDMRKLIYRCSPTLVLAAQGARGLDPRRDHCHGPGTRLAGVTTNQVDRALGGACQTVGVEEIDGSGLGNFQQAPIDFAVPPVRVKFELVDCTKEDESAAQILLLRVIRPPVINTATKITSPNYTTPRDSPASHRSSKYEHQLKAPVSGTGPHNVASLSLIVGPRATCL
ncbi:hypothetical protein B0T24DRAFT_596554 [Lasiosphaeria ovina]|uniref:Uncharacterized protein n=1 Tax=Lasiosphaeria ovina TaxID=92902 RepID=A0AAE0JYD0_9PEZI|nr:hypothetical protein B0T24DRAFT_596554 [Lasiosphaeria ovina]